MLWIFFHAILAVLLIIDLRCRVKSWKQAVLWSAIWIGVGLAWNVVIYGVRGEAQALEFFTAYLLEKSLSVDNLCVFLLIFSSFQVPLPYQRKVLLWGILGAIVLRLVLILVGLKLLQLFHPVLYLFGGLVLYSGLRLLFRSSQEPSLQKHWFFRWIQNHLPFVNHFGEGHFSVMEKGTRVWTLLTVVLILMEGSDLIFAFDSIPAVLAITQDPLIAYTSNVCAILGLRSLYFVLTPWIQQIHKAKWGLGLILLFVGSKMLLSPIWTIPTAVSLLIIALILAVTFLAAFRRK